MAKISFAEKPGSAWEPLPNGTYGFEINGVEENTSSNGNPQVILNMRVLEGPHENKTCKNFLTSTPKAAWRIREVFEACGAPLQSLGQDAEGNELFDADTDDLVGRQLQFKVRQEEYEGKTNNKFDKPVPIGGKVAAAPAGGASGTAPAAGAAKPGGYPGGASTAGRPPQGAQPRMPRGNQNG